MVEYKIDYSGLLTLNKELESKLQSFLQQKEAILADKILHTFSLASGKLIEPIIPPHEQQFRITEITEQLERIVRSQKGLEGSLVNWNELRTEVNRGLWEYVEILEGCSTELFEELSYVGFENWRPEVFEIVKNIKDDLLRRIDDLNTLIPRIEHFLWEMRAYRQSYPTVRRAFDRLQFWFTVTLDANLKKNLDNSEKYLRGHFKNFTDRFESYCDIDPQLVEAVNRYESYPILRSLDRAHQEKLIFQGIMLSCWEIAKNSSKTNLLPDIAKTLNRIVSSNKCLSYLKDYYQALNKALFLTSLSIKSGHLQSMKQTLKDSIKELSKEVQGLKSSVISYRNYLEQKDPNIDVELVNLNHDLKRLSDDFTRMNDSIDFAEDVERETYDKSLRREIEGLFHEMGRPLMSRNIMRSKVSQLIPLLKDCDELGSHSPDISQYMESTVTKALKLDSKYQTLQEFPVFHEIMHNHFGIIGPISDRSHINRMGKFKRIVQQIEQWVKAGKSQKHYEEIETDINDTKEFLQDFLAKVQRAVREGVSADREASSDKWKLFSHMLLEYRYLFSNFYAHLRQHGEVGDTIRNHFQYIERYFEAVELQLNEFKNLLEKV